MNIAAPIIAMVNSEISPEITLPTRTEMRCMPTRAIEDATHTIIEFILKAYKITRMKVLSPISEENMKLNELSIPSRIDFF